MLHSVAIRDHYDSVSITPTLRITALYSFFYLQCPRNFYIGGESHDFWEFVYIDSGRLLITAGEEQYILKAGELVFHKPGEYHSISTYADAPANIIIASFDCRDESMRFFEHRLTTLDYKKRDYLYDALRCSEQVLKDGFVDPAHLSDGDFGNLQLISGNLELLLIALIRQNNGDAIGKRVESYFQMTKSREIAERVDQYLEENLYRTITLGGIAAEMGYSVSHLNKLYRERKGISIMKAFLNLKMQEALRCMHEGNHNISQIAKLLGYEDLAHFSRTFKQHFGVSPSQYARSYIEKSK